MAFEASTRFGCSAVFVAPTFFASDCSAATVVVVVVVAAVPPLLLLFFFLSAASSCDKRNPRFNPAGAAVVLLTDAGGDEDAAEDAEEGGAVIALAAGDDFASAVSLILFRVTSPAFFLSSRMRAAVLLMQSRWFLSRRKYACVNPMMPIRIAYMSNDVNVNDENMTLSSIIAFFFSTVRFLQLGIVFLRFFFFDSSKMNDGHTVTTVINTGEKEHDKLKHLQEFHITFFLSFPVSIPCARRVRCSTHLLMRRLVFCSA